MALWQGRRERQRRWLTELHTVQVSPTVPFETKQAFLSIAVLTYDLFLSYDLLSVSRFVHFRFSFSQLYSGLHSVADENGHAHFSLSDHSLRPNEIYLPTHLIKATFNWFFWVLNVLNRTIRRSLQGAFDRFARVENDASWKGWKRL